MSSRAAVLVAAAVLLAGCTGIPTTSSPRTVAPVELGNDEPQSIVAPARGIEPRNLVLAFLAANATASPDAAQAKAYLTTPAALKWVTNTVTVIDSESVGLYQPKTSEVIVRGREVGTVNPAGVYAPQDNAPIPFVFHISKVRGEYRIDAPPKGLVLATDQFEQTFRQHNLYFYDLAGRYLVPDQRWSSASGLGLERWLLTQLANGPRPDLANAVNSETLPSQANPARLTVIAGVPTRVEVRGSSQLDPATRYRLAAQIAQMFDEVTAGLTMELTDGGTPVPISANTTQFTASQFIDSLGPTPPDPNVYFLRDGRIYTEDGKELAGTASAASLTSVALMRLSSSAPLGVAAVAGSGSDERLLVGTQFGGLTPTGVRGSLSRPAWAPGSNEVWIGRGRGIVRLTVPSTGRTGAPERVALPTISGAKQIVALRFSPEGTRVAVVIGTVSGAQQLYVGSIVRSAATVRVDTLTAISPPSVVITDAAWVEAMKLIAIGYNVSGQDARVFESDVDGASWTSRGIGLLPEAPNSVTAAPGQFAWVSAGGGVFKQSGSSWQSPGGTGQRDGSDPVYEE